MLRIAQLCIYLAVIVAVFNKPLSYISMRFRLITANIPYERSYAKWYCTLIFNDARTMSRNVWYSGSVRKLQTTSNHCVDKEYLACLIDNIINDKLLALHRYPQGLDLRVIIGTKDELSRLRLKNLKGITDTGCTLQSVDAAIRIFNGLPNIIC